jgi:hypothetical protein
MELKNPWTISGESRLVRSSSANISWKKIVSNNSYRDCWWTHEYRILRIEGLVEIIDGEIALSSFADAAPGQEWDKNAQARASNAQEGGMVLNGQRIAQRMVLWKLLSTREEPSNVNKRELGISMRKRERTT